MKPAGSYRKLLLQPPFLFYLITQFITAFNDNAFKIVVMLIALQAPESGYVDIYYILAQLVFTLPFFIFSGYSGYFSDKHPKNKVIVATKLLEVIIMLMAVYFLAKENKAMLIIVLFMLSTQSVFLSPAKYGILPEWFSEEDISRANGIVELITFIAIIIGSAIGGILMQFLGNDLILIGIILLASAIIGFVTSFGVKQVVISGTVRKMSMSPLYEIAEGIKVLSESKLLATTIAGISFFFAIGLALTTNLMVFGKEIFHLSDLQLGLMNAAMGLGIGVGSVVAGWLSGDKIEYGLIPMGAIGLTFCMFGISYTTVSLLNLYLLLSLTGFFAGLFIVPLNALLQELPDKQEKGRLIATNNFFNGAAMVLAVLLIWFLQGGLYFRSDNIMFVLAWMTLIFSIITLWLNPRFFLRFIIWLMIHIVYRVDVVGSPNIPKNGPALIVSNHVSYIDGLILSTVFPRFIRYLAHRNFYDHPLLHHLMRFAYAIPIESGSDEKVAASINRAREALKEGHIVCIFAEGRLTRTGHLLPFRTGLERIVEGLDVPIIPVHLDQLWDSFFSPRRDNQLFRVPQQFPARITVTLGDPLPATSKAWQVRQAVQELAVQSRISGYQREHYLSVEFLKTAAAYPQRYCVYDESNNCSYKYAGFSSKVLLVANKLKKIHSHENRVGILLPCNFESTLINTALVVAGKSVVNIPHEYSYNDVLQLKKLLGINSLYTTKDLAGEVSNKLINDFNAIDIKLVLKKINGNINSIKWHFIGIFKYIMPVKYVVKFIGELPASPESELAVLVPDELSLDSNNNEFIPISHESVYNNISGVKQILQCSSKDRFANFLNFNNIFSYTNSFWGAIILGSGQIPIQIDSKNDYMHFFVQIHKQQASILIANRDLIVHCLNEIPINMLAYLKYLICFDELEDEIRERFYDKFGIYVMQGLGGKEVGGFISLNSPNIRQKGMLQRGNKRGSYGHPLPNVSVRILNYATKEVLPPNEEGVLEIKTASYMSGYLEKNLESESLAQSSLPSRIDEWFNTGLTAHIDDEGFIFIK